MDPSCNLLAGGEGLHDHLEHSVLDFEQVHDATAISARSRNDVWFLISDTRGLNSPRVMDFDNLGELFGSAT